MGVAKVTLNGTTLMDTTDKTVTSETMLSGTTALNKAGNDITGSIASKNSSDLTVSGATVTVPAGYYSTNASKAVSSMTLPTAASSTSSGTSKATIERSTSAQYINIPTGYNSSAAYYTVSATPNGTEGTPTATKGTISNHAISVTPSVTNSAGYISGGTHTGTAVSVSASELVSGTLNITSSGTKDVTNYASASVASGGATASATKGTVSNHSVTVTPSVTRTAGYVTAGTSNGTAVTISASELVSGTKSITENGTDIDVINYASVNVDVPTGSSSTHTATIRSRGIRDNTGGIISLVNYESTNYITLNSNFEFNSGDTLVCQTQDYYGNYGTIYIDDDVISTGSYSYNYTLPDNDIDIYLDINGTYVKVYNVIPTISITENGEYDVSGYDLAEVNVPLSGGFTVDDIAMRAISGSISGSATSVGKYAFAFCSSLTAVNFSAATSIGSFAFYYCSKLTTASFPAATSIGSYAFDYCSSLTTANFPAATSIGSYAFGYGSKLTTVSFPAATFIGSSAFTHCSSLTTISFPAATSIGAYAFASCYRLLSLYLLGSSVTQLANLNAFISTPLSYTTDYTDGVYGNIYVPSSLYDSYLAATNWVSYSARFVSV